MRIVPDNYPRNSKCDNCGKIWFDSELNDIDNMEERLDPGGMHIPTGECPDCGTLCYVHDDGKGLDLRIKIRGGNATELLTALAQISKDIIAGHQHNWQDPPDRWEYQYVINGVPIMEGSSENRQDT